MLALGLASAALLAGVATSRLGSPRAAGEAALTRLAGEVAESVAGEWRRLLRAADRVRADEPGALRWPPELVLAGARIGPTGGQAGGPAGGQAGGPTAARPANPAAASIGDGSAAERGSPPGRERNGPTAFDVLLADASARELAGDLAGALDGLGRAVELAATERELAEAQLRSIQIARKAGDTRAVREHWESTARRLAGEGARLASPSGIAYLLLSGLAAGPALPDDEREAAYETLVAAWVEGRLALPEESARLVRGARLEAGNAGRPDDAGEPDDAGRPDDAGKPDAPGRLRLEPPLRIEALAERLAALHAGPPDAALERDLAARRLAPVAALLGGLPVVPEPGLQTLAFAGEDVFVARRAKDGGGVGRFLRAAELRAELARAARAELLPDGFALDFAGDDASLGERVRGWTPLSGPDTGSSGPRTGSGPDSGGLGFVLRHDDVEGAIAGEARAMRFLRAGLYAVAALCGLAGFATYRAMGRARRLQQLQLDFVAGVSHELRTPLSSILLMADNLEQGRVPPERHARYHALIRRESGRLRRLVDDVLDFARIERGKAARLAIEETRLAPVVAAIEEEARELAAQGGAELRFRVQDLPATGFVDAEALHRAAANLIQNALVHGAGPVAVEVRGEDGLLLTVADSGPGVPAARRAEIFRPFVQLGARANGRARGTGLGLAIVAEIARAHGGTVRVADPPVGADAPRGAVFELRLPLTPTAGDEAAGEDETVEETT